MTEPDPADLALLRSTARRVFADEPSLHALGELGLLGLLVPEQAGGSGWRVVEACVVAQEAGRALSRVPWSATVVAAGELARAPRPDPVVVRQLVSGAMAGLVARREDLRIGSGRATGELIGVGETPGVLVLVEDGRPSSRVDLGAPGVAVEPVADPLDTTRGALRLTLTDAAVVELGRGGAATVGVLLAAADSLGALDGTVERLVDYLSHRDAFGHPIASFQAIQHRLVELTVLVAAIRALVRRAAAAVAHHCPDAARLVHATHTFVARRVTAALDDCIQLSGGIGFTWEWPVHHAMRRSLTTAATAPVGRATSAALLCAPPGTDRRADTTESEYRDRVRLVIAEHAPHETREGHRAPTSPAEEAALRRWYATMYDEGLLGAAWPQQWGGRADHRPWQDLVITEELIRARAPRPIDQVLLASHVLLHFGTDEQRARYLPRIRAGDDIWCQLFSEPGAGSDLAGIQARATQRADGSWILAGQKTWTTDAHWAQMGLALLRTGDSPSRHAGITAFLVPMDSPGLVVRPMRTIGGAVEFNDVFLDGVVLDPRSVLGEVGQGWAVAMSGLEIERFTVGGNVVLLDMLLEDVLTVARPVLGQGDVRSAIADLSSQCEAAKAFIRDHADRLRDATADPTDGPIAKVLYSETYNRIARYGMELVAGHAPTGVETAARRLQDAWLWSRALTISGGSSEIMRNIIARRRLKLPS